MGVHLDERNPLSDWPHEQPEVNAEREEEVRASLSASGRIGLVVDDEANVAPQFARRPFANFEPVLFNAPSVLSSRNASFEDGAFGTIRSSRRVGSSHFLVAGSGHGSRSENFMEPVVIAAGPSPLAEVISTPDPIPVINVAGLSPDVVEVMRAPTFAPRG